MVGSILERRFIEELHDEMAFSLNEGRGQTILTSEEKYFWAGETVVATTTRL